MTNEEFGGVVDEVFAKCKVILEEKGKFYSTPENRFQNFDESAADQEILPEVALRGMVSKHTTAINKYITDLSYEIYASKEHWEASIFDVINYYLLLYGLLRDQGEV